MEKDRHADQNLFPSWLKQPALKDPNNENKTSYGISENISNIKLYDDVNPISNKYSIWNNSQSNSHISSPYSDNYPKFEHINIRQDNYKDDYHISKPKTFRPHLNSYGLNGTKPVNGISNNCYKPVKKLQPFENGDSHFKIPQHINIGAYSNEFYNNKNKYDDLKDINTNTYTNGKSYHSSNRKYVDSSHYNDQNKWNPSYIPGDNSYSSNLTYSENINSKNKDWPRDQYSYKNTKSSYTLWNGNGNSYNSYDPNKPASPSYQKKINNVNWKYKEPSHQNGSKWANQFQAPSNVETRAGDDGKYHSKWKQQPEPSHPYAIIPYQNSSRWSGTDFKEYYSPTVHGKGSGSDYSDPDPLSSFLNEDPILLQDGDEYRHQDSYRPESPGRRHALGPHDYGTTMNGVDSDEYVYEDRRRERDITPTCSPHKLSSSLEAEHKLLQSMGWSGSVFENEEPLTEAEVDEFLQKTAMKYRGKQAKNGVLTLTR